MQQLVALRGHGLAVVTQQQQRHRCRPSACKPGRRVNVAPRAALMRREPPPHGWLAAPSPAPPAQQQLQRASILLAAAYSGGGAAAYGYSAPQQEPFASQQKQQQPPHKVRGHNSCCLECMHARAAAPLAQNQNLYRPLLTAINTKHGQQPQHNTLLGRHRARV